MLVSIRLLALLAIAVISVVPIFYCVWGTQARAQLVDRHRAERIDDPHLQPIVSQFKSVLTNRAFLCVVGIYLCSWFSLQLIAAIIPYFTTSWMGLPIGIILAYFYPISRERHQQILLQLAERRHRGEGVSRR